VTLISILNTLLALFMAKHLDFFGWRSLQGGLLLYWCWTIQQVLDYQDDLNYRDPWNTGIVKRFRFPLLINYCNTKISIIKEPDFFLIIPGNFSGPNIHPDNQRLAVLPINDSCCLAETLLKHTWSMITITHLKVSKVWLGRLQCLKNNICY